MIINSIQAVGRTYKGEVNDKPSMTVPNQSLTIPEILRRFANGSMIPETMSKGYYDGYDDFDSYDPTLDPSFDLSDISAMRAELDERRQAAARLREAQDKEKADKAADEAKRIAEEEEAKKALTETAPTT